MNTDGASKGNPGISSVGGILRDQLEKVIFVFQEPLGNITNTQAELHAIHRGLQICIDRGFRNVWIEIDATAIIKGCFWAGWGLFLGQLRAIYLLFLAAHTPAYAHLGVGKGAVLYAFFVAYIGFYKRFIKVFSKIAQPLCKLLQKDEAFEFDEA
ncbi:UNVERIFIED_CONTAM: putative ribonuclease H protein [Sesamum latifolium]|uniref:Ribonuclease H protein n=1 Tax=Sesamum latifolium TaxID=2727402 RepID=A0AAW2YC15_9LAMI